MMGTWLGLYDPVFIKPQNLHKNNQEEYTSNDDSDFSDSDEFDNTRVKKNLDASDAEQLEDSNLHDNSKIHRRNLHDKLNRSFAILKGRIDDENLDISEIRDLNDEFHMGDTHENAELDDTIDDHEDTRTDLMEDWDKKFEEWRTPKKRLFLAKLMQSINSTEEWMKDITTDIFHLPAVENKTAPVEQHRSSVNGRIVPDNQVRHPHSHDMFSTTEAPPINHKKNSLSNDSLAFTLVYCSVFLVTLFYIGYKLTKKWRNQDEENEANTIHTTGINGYVCNHTLCREARQRNAYLYGNAGPHNTALCDNGCENCRRLSQPPPSYSKICLDESDPPAYTDDMDRQCPCRRSQNSRVSLCLFQNSADNNTSQDSQDIERSASVAVMNTASMGGSSPRPGSAPTDNLTSVTVHPAPSYLTQPAPSYAEFPKPGEHKSAGHTRGSMENIPENPGLKFSTIHHPIFTVDEESSDEESITVTTPILSRENVNAAIENAPPVNSSPTAPNENIVNNTLTTLNGDAVNKTDENKITSATPDDNKDESEVEDTPIDNNDENAAIITPADCVNATSSVENSSIIIEKSR